MSKRLVEKGRFHRTYQLDDGSFSQEIFGVPMHYEKGGNWHDIDNQIVDSGKAYKHKAEHLDIMVKDVTDVGHLVQWENGSDWVKLDIDSILYRDTNRQVVLDVYKTGKNSKADHNTVNFEEYFANIDAQFEFENDRVKSSVIFKKRIVVKDGDLWEGKIVVKNRITLSPGITLNYKGTYFEVTKNGRFLFYLHTPVVKDAEGRSEKCEYELVEEDGQQYILEIMRYGWLLSEEKAYPITLDPSIDPNPSQDVETWPSGSKGVVYQTFFKFDISSIPAGATITDATFYGYITRSSSTINCTPTVSAYRVTNDQTWTESSAVSVFNAMTIGNALSSHAFAGASEPVNVYVSWSVMSGVQADYGAGNSFFTLYLYSSTKDNSTDSVRSDNNGIFTFGGGDPNGSFQINNRHNASNKPHLTITYTTGGGAVAPTVTTQAVSNIGKNTATGNGNVTADGGATITQRGVCWKTSSGPTTADSKATASGTTGAFTAAMTGLSLNTTYYVRAYAINSAGTSYGSEVTFRTNNAVGITDSGSGADALPGVLAKVSVQQTGTGNDAVPTVRVKIGLQESGTGQESTGLKVPVAAQDSATANEAVSALIRFLVSDSFSANDAATVLSKLALAESGGASDTLAVKAGVKLSDSGTVADVVKLAVKLSQADSGVGTEIVTALMTAAKISVADSGTGADALRILARLALTDSGIGAEAVTALVRLTMADSAQGTDLISARARMLAQDAGIGADLAKLLIRVAQVDAGTGSDILKIISKLTQSDSGIGIDAIIASATVLQKSVQDSGTGTDAVSLLFKLSLTDTALGHDAVSALAKVALSDTAIGGEVLSLSARVFASDSGTGADTVRIVAKVFAIDHGAASDVLSLLQRVQATDSGAFQDVAATVVKILRQDAGAADDIVSLIGRQKIADAGTAAEALEILTAIHIAETGSAEEVIGILNRLSLSDFGLGAELVKAINRLLQYHARKLYTPVKQYTPRSLYKPRNLYQPKP